MYIRTCGLRMWKLKVQVLSLNTTNQKLNPCLLLLLCAVFWLFWDWASQSVSSYGGAKKPKKPFIPMQNRKTVWHLRVWPDRHMFPNVPKMHQGFKNKPFSQPLWHIFSTDSTVLSLYNPKFSISTFICFPFRKVSLCACMILYVGESLYTWVCIGDREGLNCFTFIVMQLFLSV